LALNILVCGGAGYIGSHMVRTLLAAGHRVSILDNLSTGFVWSIPKEAFFLNIDLLDAQAVEKSLITSSFDAVMHFSALSLVGESVKKPESYYQNNVVGTLNLLQAMKRAGVNKFVFSSTAATFGNPVSDLIDENHPQITLRPMAYGLPAYVILTPQALTRQHRLGRLMSLKHTLYRIFLDPA